MPQIRDRIKQEHYRRIMAVNRSVITKTVRILLHEEDPVDTKQYFRKLKNTGLQAEVDVAPSSEEFMEHVRKNTYDIVLSDYHLSGWNGVDALKWLRSVGREWPFILVTAALGDELAIECIKAGVSDYVPKGNLERLPIAIRRALEQQKLREEHDWAENELRDSEKRYRFLFNANPNPMWVFDPVTLRFLTVNQAAIHHYGFSLKEFLSMTLEDIRPASDVDRFLQSVDPSIDTGETYAQTWRHKKKDGTIIDVEISSQPITWGNIQAQLVLAHDVTAQRRAETQLRESKEQLQLLLDSTAEGIYAVDLNGTCTLCNAAALRILGYSDESELLGRNTHTAIHHTRPDGSSYPIEECKMYECLRQGTRVHVADEVLWRSDGTNFSTEYWSYPIRREECIVGAVVTFIDITERKNAEEQLRRSEGRYRSVITNAPYGIFRVDENGHIIMANPAFAAMLGYTSAEEVLGLNTATDVYLDDADRLRARRYASEVPAVGYETKWKHRGGKTITVRLGGRRLPDGENSGGFEVFVEDVTEQRSLRRQFEHAQKMEAVGRVAGAVAHDFNNTIGIVVGYSSLLRERLPKDEKALSYVDQISQAGERASSLTRQLLAFSRKEFAHPTIVDLNHVLRDLGKMMPRLLGEDVEITSRLDPQLAAVYADRGQLEQIIMNLAVNARDAMPGGGHLTFKTENITFSQNNDHAQKTDIPAGRYVLLSVRDTGTGMTAETQAHLFEPFFTTKEEGKGTGLGLANVYALVKQLGGFITVDSELNQGSTFRIYLPVIDTTLTAQPPQEIVYSPRGKETILLAEDEEDLRRMYRLYLESKGYTVLDAVNGSAALELCRKYQAPIHVLIADMVMPGLGGLALAMAALALRPALTVLVMSGYTDRALEAEASRIGAKFLQKPFSLDALARTLGSLLPRNRILLIEDSKFIANAIGRALGSAGYIVRTTSHGEEGTRSARSTQPDLIILDMVLQGSSGFEVLRNIKKDYITKETPVLVISALSKKEVARVMAQGAAAYLQKSELLLADNLAVVVDTVKSLLAKTSEG